MRYSYSALLFILSTIEIKSQTALFHSNDLVYFSLEIWALSISLSYTFTFTRITNKYLEPFLFLSVCVRTCHGAI